MEADSHTCPTGRHVTFLDTARYTRRPGKYHTITLMYSLT
jgi:hypothetical protein